MRIWSGLTVSCALLAACAAQAGETSWGKANVTLGQYLTDAATCANAAAGVRSDPEVLVQGRGAGVGSGGAAPGSAESAEASQDSLLAQANSQGDAQLRADRRARQNAQDQCLIELGYTAFRLTPEQNAHLKTLPEGSRERRDYLHQLAADPAVLAAQKM
jgi:hypothetical protein